MKASKIDSFESSTTYSKKGRSTSALQKRKKGHKKTVSKQCLKINTPYRVYLCSLALSGRKSMVTLLNKSATYLEWTRGAEYFEWHKIDYEMISHVRTSFQHDNYACTTINQALAAIRGVVNAAFNLGLVDADTVMRLKSIKKVQGDRLPVGRSLNGEDVDAMVSVCNRRSEGVKGKRNASFILLALYSGMRSAELINLKVGDVNIHAGTVKVMQRKGGKQKEIFLAPVALKAVKAWLVELGENDGYFFRRMYKGGSIGSAGLSSAGVAKILRYMATEASICKFSVHDLRRSFITRLLETGVELTVVKELASHNDVKTTLKYDFRDTKVQRKASQNMVY